MRNRVLIVVLAAVALGGCGGDADAERELRRGAQAQVAAVREAARRATGPRRSRRWTGWPIRCADLEAGGSLAEADAEALRRGIARAKRRARAEIAEPTPAADAEPTPTPTATATATAEPPPARPAEPGKGKGKGKGKEGKKD